MIKNNATQIEIVLAINELLERVDKVEKRTTELESYFIGTVTDSTHYVSSGTSWTQNAITITKGLITSI